MSHFATNNSSSMIQKMCREYNHLRVENQHMAQRIVDLEKILAARDEQINEFKSTVSHYQALSKYFEEKYLDALEWAEALL